MFDLYKSKENIKTTPRNYSSNELGEKSGWNCLLVSVTPKPPIKNDPERCTTHNMIIL